MSATSFTNTTLHYDAAQTLPDSDEFGFRVLADRLSENVGDLLRAKNAGGGFVLGLEGRWGSGKSTILNYLRVALQGSLDKDRQFLIDFDPWWLEEDGDVVSALLGGVLDALPRTEATKVQGVLGKLAGAAGALPEGLDVLLKLSKKTEGLAEMLGAARQAGGDLGKLLNASKPVRRLREEVGAAFAERSLQFVVLVDDLDRLAPERAIRVMNAIKSVADLPGFVYVLAYDPQALGNILQSYNPPLGTDYFEKIINVSVPVPPVTFFQMTAFVRGLLRPALKAPIEASPLHQRALVGMLEAPRDAIRLANAANFWVGGKVDELHPPDFLLLEAIRMTRPMAYLGILRTSEIWLHAQGTDFISRALGEEPSKAANHAAAVKKAVEALGLGDTPRDKAIRATLGVLFPKATEYLGEAAGFEPTYEAPPADPRGIGQSGSFFTYFLHRPLPGSPTRPEIDALTNPTTPSAERRALVAAISGRSVGDVAPLIQLIALLDGERDFDRVDPAVLFDLVLAMIAPTTQRRRGGIDESDLMTVRGFAARSLTALKRLDAEQVEALTTSDLDLDIAGAIHLVLSAGTPRYLPQDRSLRTVVTADDTALGVATTRLVDRILTDLMSNALFATETGPRLLYMAFTLKPEPLRARLQAVFDDDRRLVALLEAYKGFGNPYRNLAQMLGATPETVRGRITEAYDALGYAKALRMEWDWDWDE